MKSILLLITLFCALSICYGQGLGIQTGGGEVWTENIDTDVDTTLISISDASPNPYHLHQFEGAGGAVGGSAKSSKGHAEGTETTKLLRPGALLSITCKIAREKGDDQTLKVELKWYKDDKMINPEAENSPYKIFQENATLQVPSASVDDVGVYRCETLGFDPPRSYNVSVVYHAYKSMPKSITVLEGDKLSISCDVEGVPAPSITWFKDNVNVEEAVNNTRYEVTTNDKGTINATYVVEKAIYDDRANYTCFVSIGDIQYNMTTYVRVKDMYAALWPFLGICAEVFILCLIIFVYEKRRAKNDFEESDTDQPPEQKNPSDQNKDSVRHRK